MTQVCTKCVKHTGWNHSTCSVAFFLDICFSDLCVVLPYHILNVLNSQMAEQWNSPLKGHASAIRCMAQATALRSIRLVCRWHQSGKIASLKAKAAAALALHGNAAQLFVHCL